MDKITEAMIRSKVTYVMMMIEEEVEIETVVATIRGKVSMMIMKVTTKGRVEIPKMKNIAGEGMTEMVITQDEDTMKAEGLDTQTGLGVETVAGKETEVAREIKVIEVAINLRVERVEMSLAVGAEVRAPPGKEVGNTAEIDMTGVMIVIEARVGVEVVAMRGPQTHHREEKTQKLSKRN